MLPSNPRELVSLLVASVSFSGILSSRARPRTRSPSSSSSKKRETLEWRRHKDFPPLERLSPVTSKPTAHVSQCDAPGRCHAWASVLATEHVSQHQASDLRRTIFPILTTCFLDISVSVFGLVASLQAMEQAKRYDGLAAQCKNVSPALDLGYFVRTLPLPPNVQRIPRKAFAPPQPANPSAIAQDHQASADELQDYGMVSRVTAGGGPILIGIETTNQRRRPPASCCAVQLCE